MPLTGTFPVLSRGIIDGHPGLHIVHIDMETDTLATVLQGDRLHLDAAGKQIFPFKHRRYPVQHMVACFLNKVRHHILKGQHALGIQIPGAGDQILLIGILAGKLKTDQMTAVIQRLSVHKIVSILHPTRRFYVADAASVLCGHKILANTGLHIGTTPQSVQIVIGLIGRSLPHLLLSKQRYIVVDNYIGRAGIGRDIVYGYGVLGGLQQDLLSACPPTPPPAESGKGQ